MNIKQAKDQVKYAIEAYLTKNDENEYAIPLKEQRPLFIMGPPGIGKTDIMKQVAEELSIGMVSYSMTHHTRQSALGLPYIIEKEFQGQKYQVSEYTMSEIVSTIYDIVEEDGVREGILFLDEINCVSETLAPSMLQFLQFKTFGKHRIPDGWVVVAAGNPPEYNNSVREFDIVTLDRLKRLDVEADYDTFINHAKIQGVHPAILSYLELKQYDFYKIETNVDGKSFVTARGWVDLSQMLRIFEEKDFVIDETLVVQYLQNREIAKNFAMYYDLFKKYQADYAVQDILKGKAGNEILARATKAEFDERLALITMIVECLTNSMRVATRMEKWGIAFSKEAMTIKTLKTVEDIKAHSKKLQETLSKKRHANSISTEDTYLSQKIIACFADMVEHYSKDDSKVEIDKYSKEFYTKHKKKVEKEIKSVQKEIENALSFTHEAFGESQAFFLVLTQLTSDPVCADFLSKYGGDSYFKYNKALLVHDNQKEILDEIDEIDDEYEDDE